MVTNEELITLSKSLANLAISFEAKIEIIKSVALRTPKKPDFEGDGYDDKGNLIYDRWYCPYCNKEYEVDYDNYDYCPNCGQKIDWSENNDN